MGLNTFTEVNGTTSAGKSIFAHYLNTMTPGGTAGVAITNIGFQGGTASASVFDSLTLSQSLQFGKGILLTTGDGTPNRTNTGASVGTAFGTNNDGNTELSKFAKDAFPSAGATQDATVLTIYLDVTDPAIKSVRFDIAFGSDEYPEYSNSSFVDIGAVWANGVNYGLINGNTDQPLSVVQKNLALNNFINNQNGALAIEYDGFVNKQFVYVPVQPGANVINIGIADTGDSIYDSGIFITGMTSSNIAAAGTYQEVLGSVASELMVGSGNSELFLLMDGDDVIYGAGGNDLIYAGTGNDVGVLSVGNDSFFGEDGNDYAYLGGGNDTAAGGNGTDVLLGEAGNDVLFGDTGSDYLFGGIGDDKMEAKNADAASVTVMFGEDGADSITGGAGTNHIFGGAGLDTLQGGSGLNIFISSGETQGDLIYGGSGQNYVYGSNGGDTIFGGTGTDVFILGSGNDVVEGGGGVDYVWGGGGFDKFHLDVSKGGVLVVQDFDFQRDTVYVTGGNGITYDNVANGFQYVASIDTSIYTNPITGAAIWLIGVGADQLSDNMVQII